MKLTKSKILALLFILIAVGYFYFKSDIISKTKLSHTPIKQEAESTVVDNNLPSTHLKIKASEMESVKIDIHEKYELENTPETELEELAKIYENRGLTRDLSVEVAKQLTHYNALESHARDELGINEITQARPFQAALASAVSFIVGGLLPLLISIFAPVKQMITYQYGFSIIFLAISGTFAAKVGGSIIYKSVVRICVWGTFAMLMSALVGYIFGVKVN